MNLDNITTTIKKMLELMNIQADIAVVDDTDLHLPVVTLTTKEPNLLIGHRGETLMAFSHILKKIADSESDDRKLSFIVDVNGYQKKHINEIKDKARILVERAKYYKSSVEMEPMSPYERMIVHALFSEDKNINTSSTGVGRERRVVIEYVGE
jgi:spoIIIJ-associated protein